MKRFLLLSALGGLVLLAGGFSFVSAQQKTYYIYEGAQITCSDNSQDPKCIAAKKAAAEAAAKAAYCQSTTICGTASAPMSLLMNFVNEMINAIHTQGTEGEYLGQYVSPNRFKGNVFTPPAETVVSRVARNAAQKLKFTMAATAIFSSPVNIGGLKDFAGSTTLLSKNKVFLRDAKLIETLETQLSTKKYELGAGGGRYEKITGENLSIMRSILKTYVDAGLFQESSKLNDGVLYNNITSLLTSMLSDAKTFLYFDATGQFDQISRGGINGVKISFDPAAISVISADYSCARGLTDPCDQHLNTFKDTLSALIESTKSSASGFLSTVTDAIDRLENVFSPSQKQSAAFKAREAELLKTMYGTTKVDSVRMSKPLNASSGETNGSLGSTVDSVSALATGSASVASALAQGAVRSWNALFSRNIDKKESDIVRIVSTASTGEHIESGAFSQIMDQYLADVFVSHAVDRDITISSEVKDVTPAFTALGSVIQFIKTSILDDLTKNLREAARLQCSQ